MAKTFCRSDHGPRKLRIAIFCGLVFGRLSDDVPPIEEYLGEEIASRIKRVLHKPVVVTGRFTQMLQWRRDSLMRNAKRRSIMLLLLEQVQERLRGARPIVCR